MNFFGHLTNLLVIMTIVSCLYLSVIQGNPFPIYPYSRANPPQAEQRLINYAHSSIRETRPRFLSVRISAQLINEVKYADGKLCLDDVEGICLWEVR